jgi:DNA-binding beta-propeller fold protein YncE
MVIRAFVALGVVSAWLMCSVPADAKAPFGALAQLPGRDGCTGVYFDSCRPGTLGGEKVVLSPDDAFVYAASSDGTVAGYRRNSETGALRGLSGTRGCIVGPVTFGEVAAASVCTQWDLFGPIPDVAIAMSPDGRHIYLGTGGTRFEPPRESQRPGALATLDRDVATGELRPAGCISPAVGACASARGVGRWVADVAVSPDGTNVYVVSPVEVGTGLGSSIAVFTRNPVSGALSQLPNMAGCVAPEAYSGCATARGLTDSTSSVIVTPDGRNVYVATADYLGPVSEGTILAFARDQVTGALVQLPGAAGCLASDGREGCGRAQPLGSWPTQLPELAVSPDGRNVYAPFVSADGLAGGVTILRRDLSTGGLTQLPGESGCISQRPIPSCQRGRGLEDPTGISVSPDGRNVYESAYNSAAIAVFARRADGALQQLSGRFGCIGGSPLFHEGCAPSSPLQQDIALSSDGSYGYVARDDGLLVFARNGPQIRLRIPAQHCAPAGLRIGVQVWTWGGLRRAAVRLDRRLIASRARRRFDVVIPTGGLAARGHRVSVLAIDRRGRRALRVRRVAGCRRG